MAIDLACPAEMGTEEYSQHATPLLKLLQIAYEVQLTDMEELELRIESSRSLEQVVFFTSQFAHWHLHLIN
ncbi:MAG: hypothetical protein HC767_05340 [Akkermansiaceae bacterium]|nr:hypothetical protein [Akkermansiaceae bacterium]